MSNVIALNATSRLAPLDDRISNLASCFSSHRRKVDDVYWLILLKNSWLIEA